MKNDQPFMQPLGGLSALGLCVHRLYGRRVASSRIPIPAGGLVLGADNAFMATGVSTYGTLHVAPRHAVVRAVDGYWVLEPACREMVVVLNGEKVLWGTSRRLGVGDRIDLGLAVLLVEAWPSETLASASRSLVVPTARQEKDLAGSDNTAEGAVETPGVHLPPSDQTGASAAGISAAEELRAMLTKDAGDSAGFASMFYAEPGLPEGSGSQGDPEGASVLVLEASTPAPATPDILVALAQESVRVLAGRPFGEPAPEGFGEPGNLAAQFAARQEPDFAFADNPFVNRPSPTASLEEILEGPLGIDEVLERLKRGQPVTAGTREDSAETAFCQLDLPDRTPDPLFLLAGLEESPVRESELAPVLHREHRMTGINTPYRFGSPRVVGEGSPEEEPWPTEPR